MKWIRRYNESKIIEATNETIGKIVRKEIDKLGEESDLNHINVSEVTNMKSLFEYLDFNGDISNWNVKNVQNMESMFYSSPFNGDISKWNVGNVNNMRYMFRLSKFNGDISQWDVHNVKNMYGMFSYSNFCGDLSYWDVNKLEEKDYFLYNSPMKNRQPWWWVIGNKLKSYKLIYESIKIYDWINLERKIIWKKRLKYALEDFGKKDSKIPKSIWGFNIY